MKKEKKVYAIVYKVKSFKSKIKVFEDTLGPNGNVSYQEWRQIREDYIDFYGENGVEFALVTK